MTSPEQAAFEAWATSNNFDITMHPMHYIFLDQKTAAARDAWRAGMGYGARGMKALLDKQAAPNTDEHYTNKAESAWDEGDARISALLNSQEKKNQATRCGCKGTDDYCVCQNVADDQTMNSRK